MTTDQPQAEDKVKVLVDLALAANAAKESTLYRLWLVCRHLDPVGRGYILIPALRAFLSSKAAEDWRLGERRLRQLLTKGQSKYWTFTKDSRGRFQDRLFLVGQTALAKRLRVVKLTGKPVALSIQHLATIGEFKANIFSCWHAARPNGKSVSRATLAKITSVPERTQFHYDRVAGTESQQVLAIGSERHGQGTFHFTDVEGKQGQSGRSYVAWQRPNIYTAKHSTTAKGRQRKINSELKDLVNKGMQGNSGEGLIKLNFANGREAAEAHSKRPMNDAYYHTGRKTRGGSYEIQGVIEAQC